MTIKEKFTEVKKILLGELPADIPATNQPGVFTDYTLADGTIISCSSLEIGGSVTINDTPAPDGTYTIQDGTIITVAGGVISNLEVAAPAEDPGNMNAKYEADFDSFKNEFAAYKASITQQFAQQSAIIQRQEQAITKLLSLVESMSKDPIAAPVDVPKSNFSANVVQTQTERALVRARQLKEAKQ